MYRVCIPVNNRKYTEKEWDSLIRELKKADVDVSSCDFAVITLYK